MKQINFRNWSCICMVTVVVTTMTLLHHDGVASAAGEEQYSNFQPVDYNNGRQERTPPPPPPSYSNSQPVDYNNDRQERTPPPPSFFDTQPRSPPPPSCVTQLIPCLSYLYGVTGGTSSSGSGSGSGSSSTRTSSPNYFNGWNNDRNNNGDNNNDENNNDENRNGINNGDDNGGNNNEDELLPPRNCCDPLMSVIKSNPECLCTMISNEVTSKAGQAGINITRAQELPAKCGQIVNPIACLAIAAANNNNRIMRSPSSTSNTAANINYKLVIFLVSSWAAYMRPWTGTALTFYGL